MMSRLFSARIAAVYWRLRITKRAIATLPDDSSARASRT